MDISLENRINPLNNNNFLIQIQSRLGFDYNFIEFKDTESHKDFWIQLYLSEYFIQSLVHACYAGWIRLPPPVMTTIEKKLFPEKTR